MLAGCCLCWPRIEFRKIVTLDNVQATRSRKPLKAWATLGGLQPFSVPCLPIGGTPATAIEWGKRALVTCAVLATLFWAAAAPADDPVQRARSLISQERYSEAREVLEPLLKREPNVPRLRLMHGDSAGPRRERP